jgi:hypothetical protein
LDEQEEGNDNEKEANEFNKGALQGFVWIKSSLP